MTSVTASGCRRPATRAGPAVADRVRRVARGHAVYAIGPGSGALTVHTGRAGVGAAVGHDLVLEVTGWNGTVELDADQPDSCSVRVTVDPRSFNVRAGTGGMRPLTASDRSEIRRNIDKMLAPILVPSITCRSTAAVVAGENLSVTGERTVGTSTRSTRSTESSTADQVRLRSPPARRSCNRRSASSRTPRAGSTACSRRRGGSRRRPPALKGLLVTTGRGPGRKRRPSIRGDPATSTAERSDSARRIVRAAKCRR